MILSIFNFDKRVGCAVRTFAGGICIFAVYNFMIWKIQRDDPGGKIAEKKFWFKKIQPRQRYNAVFLGDSRCVYGIDPSYLEKQLGKSVFNAGFLAGGLNKTIFEHTENNLLEKSEKELRCVVLSVTPSSLSTTGDANECFYSALQFCKKDGQDASSSLWTAVFKRLNTKEIKNLWGDGLSKSFCHPNGWQEQYRQVRKKSQRNAVQHYKKVFANIVFRQKTMDELLQQTKAWKEKNITVFAFYIPSSPVFQELELSIPTWSLEKFKKQFENAGGVFLEISNRESYNAYDAIHLGAEDAKRLSADLAGKISGYLAGKNKVFIKSVQECTR